MWKAYRKPDAKGRSDHEHSYRRSFEGDAYARAHAADRVNAQEHDLVAGGRGDYVTALRHRADFRHIRICSRSLPNQPMQIGARN